jgi:ADP-heptose:LPS heptosyltransferase
MCNHTALFKDFADTAAYIANLDLVIAVDTSTAHLASAMGKEVWMMNRMDTCWRWLVDRSDTPWYPTMKIYRQPKSGDWESVIQNIKEDLIKWSK